MTGSGGEGVVGGCRGVTHLGAGHAPLGGAVHEGGEGQATAALAVPLPEELFFQLVGPPLVCARRCCQVPNVCTLQHHLHAPTHALSLSLKRHARVL